MDENMQRKGRVSLGLIWPNGSVTTTTIAEYRESGASLRVDQHLKPSNRKYGDEIQSGVKTQARLTAYNSNRLNQSPFSFTRHLLRILCVIYRKL